MTASLFDLADQALDAVIAGLEARHAEAEGVAETLACLKRQERPHSGVPGFSPRQDPACRHLDAGLAAARQVDPDLGAALEAIAPLLDWHRIPPHVPRPPEPFMDDYAYTKIVGPGGVYPGDDFMLGLFIIGPHQFYPDHLHDAPEFYWLFSGPSNWRFAVDAPWNVKLAGALQWNQAHLSHAMQTGEVALFSLWAWTRDIAGDFTIVGAEGKAPLNSPPAH